MAYLKCLNGDMAQVQYRNVPSFPPSHFAKEYCPLYNIMRVFVMLALYARLAFASSTECTLCMNHCGHGIGYDQHQDGYCDDGGDGSEYDICAFGTDCDDCGVRRQEEYCPRECPPSHPCCSHNNSFFPIGQVNHGLCYPDLSFAEISAYNPFSGLHCTADHPTCMHPPSPHLPPSPPFPPPPLLCIDDCHYNGRDMTSDGICNDGGPGSEFSKLVCTYGHDCTDCGDRVDGMCTNECTGLYGIPTDGVCDDGGPGSTHSTCSLGTDCNDCGLREYPSPPMPPAVTQCTNDCPYGNAFNRICDDGGPGSEFSVCPYGTDCQDCGIREISNPPSVAFPTTVSASLLSRGKSY